ncbi:MAG: hypothetical protein LBR79_04295 [Oscillospiraceae bacterium]|jgi:hypothetical protein|nr:hypothetical protein [Oscillospiraceae bacterium]
MYKNQKPFPNHVNDLKGQNLVSLKHKKQNVLNEDGEINTVDTFLIETDNFILPVSDKKSLIMFLNAINFQEDSFAVSLRRTKEQGSK